MARVTEKGIVGLVGDLVFYTVNGKSYVRSKPRRRKKIKGAKAHPVNTVFGTVSKYGTGMMNEIKPSLSFPVGRDAYNKLRGWIRNLYAEHHQDKTWELSSRYSGMCQLNTEVDFRDYFKSDITVTDKGKGKILITLPEIEARLTLKSPIRTMKVNLKLMAVTSPFKETGSRSNLILETISFTLNKKTIPATEVLLQTKASSGHIALVVAALEYETENSGKGQVEKELRWLPAAAIALGRLKK